MIRLSGSYRGALQEKKSIIVSASQTLGLRDGVLISTAAETSSSIVIGPLNCNLDFSSIDRIPMLDLTQAAAAPVVELPERFDLAESLPGITPPQTQGNCGCCWAIAVATAVSDQFLYQGLTPYNPMLSYTDLIACYEHETNQKCGGANPAMALTWASQHGLAPQIQEVGSYQWCTRDPQCIGATQVVPVGQLNSLIPPCVSASLRFFPLNPTTPTHTQQSTPVPGVSGEAVEAGSQAIKTFLYTKGPAVVGLHVYSNLIHGNFLCNGDNPDNIYFDTIDYTTCRQATDPPQWIGSHAVVATGWGVGRVKGFLLGSPEEFVIVPYWIIRNSWGEKWGINGYFRLAAYPFNKLCQLDVSVEVEEMSTDPLSKQQTTQKILTGGTLFCDLGGFGYDLGGPVEGFAVITKPRSIVPIGEIVSLFLCCMILFLIFFTLLVLVFHGTKKKDERKQKIK